MQWVLLIVATTNISLIAVSLKRYTLYPVLGLVCYYCILYFSLEMIYIRQATAVALCFYALRYVQEKKVWKYMLLVIVACLFHRIAIVMIPFYWLLDRSYNIWAYITIMAVGIVVMAIGILWFKPVFLNMSSLLGEGFYNKALEYATSDRFAVSRTISIGFYLNALIFAAVMLFKKEIEQLPYGKIQLNMFCLSLLMYYYGYELIEVSNRVRLFFLIGIIALLPMLLQVLQTNMSKLIATVPILLYCFSFSMHIFTEQPRAIAYNPYQNCIVMGITGQKSTGAKRLQQSKQHFDKERKR